VPTTVSKWINGNYVQDTNWAKGEDGYDITKKLN